MTGVGFILFGLSFVLFPCQGQIIPPPDGTELTFLNGSTANITWSFKNELPEVRDRAWYFTSSDGLFNLKLLASIVGDQGPQIEKSGLSGVAIVKPATLILKNVNQTCNGTYEFTLAAPKGGSSGVDVFIAITPNVTVNCSSPIILNQSDYFACECKGQGGNPPADVTWYKGNEQNGEQKDVTGKEEQILRLPNVNKDDNGTFTCVAKSHEKAKNVKEIELIVNYPPEIVNLTLRRTGDKVTITCESDGRPVPSFKIFLYETLVKSDTIYNIYKVDNIHVGNYTCVATNFLGNKTSKSVYLTLKEPSTSPPPTTPPPTTPTTKPINPTTTVSTSVAASQVIPSPTSNGKDNFPGCRWWCIMLIVIAVLVVLVIIACVVYRCKKKEKDGCRGNADVSPGGSGGVPVNHYELDEEPTGGVDNAYDTVNTSGASGSKSKPPENTLPPVHAAVDKSNKEGKPLYATLDTIALHSNNSKKKRDEERPGQTEYASIDFSKIGKADQE